MSDREDSLQCGGIPSLPARDGVGSQHAATLQVFITGSKLVCGFCHGLRDSPANHTQVALDCALLWPLAGITALIRDRFQKQQH